MQIAAMDARMREIEEVVGPSRAELERAREAVSTIGKKDMVGLLTALVLRAHGLTAPRQAEVAQLIKRRPPEAVKRTAMLLHGVLHPSQVLGEGCAQPVRSGLTGGAAVAGAAGFEAGDGTASRRRGDRCSRSCAVRRIWVRGASGPGGRERDPCVHRDWCERSDWRWRRLATGAAYARCR